MISITEKAAENIKTLREEYGAHDSIFRFGISGGGCSSYPKCKNIRKKL